MTCTACGKQNPTGARFCVHCGAPISGSLSPENTGGSAANIRKPAENLREPAANARKPAENLRKPAVNARPASPVPKKPPKKMSGGTVAVLVEAAVFFCLLVAAVMLYLFVNKPEQVARRYVNALLDKEWATAYRYLDKDNLEGELTSEEAFVTAMTLSDEDAATDNLRVDQVTVLDRSFSEAYVYVSLLENYADQDARYYTLKRDGLFWKVQDNDSLSANASLSVLHGATLTFDGYTLSELLTPSEDGAMDVYRLPLFFGGRHYVTAALDGFETTETLVIIYGNASQSIDLRYASATYKEVSAKALEDFETIVTCAMKNTDVNNVAPITQMLSSGRNTAINQYETLRDYTFHYSSYSSAETREVILSNIETTAEGGDWSTYNDYEGIPVSVDIHYDRRLTVEYTFSGTDQSTISTEATLVYVYKDNAWTLASVSI